MAEEEAQGTLTFKKWGKEGRTFRKEEWPEDKYEKKQEKHNFWRICQEIRGQQNQIPQVKM